MVLDQDLGTLVFDFDGTLFHLPVDFDAVRRELSVGQDAKIGVLLQEFVDAGDVAGLDVVTKHERLAVQAGDFTAGSRAGLADWPRRFNVAILTRNSRHCVVDALGPLADGLFIVGREDVRRLKPDPEGLHLVIEHFGTTADRCVMVGDTFHDVQSAAAAGVRSVVVRNPLLAYAPEGADVYLDDLVDAF